MKNTDRIPPLSYRFVKLLSMAGLIFLSAGLLLACVDGSKKEERTRSLKDLEKAITVIESRREAEREVIRAQERQIALSEENIERARSEAMKEKLERDIVLYTTNIERAKRNIANQDSVLIQLQVKRDSLLAIPKVK